MNPGGGRQARGARVLPVAIKAFIRVFKTDPCRYVDKLIGWREIIWASCNSVKKSYVSLLCSLVTKEDVMVVKVVCICGKNERRGGRGCMSFYKCVQVKQVW